ncbi:UDP-forming cellulose synthase catalytic subunit [Acidithiobacillus sp. AMEEHan]|uniref:UDP-forming cellulose synthase catalytic subunit n=1 Tax=Acidithiobacillus sp. AMEEHan TaxID=2994951 RepID=UPI0027E46A04|nr:UDP-forming cellulose synthase catalytic subunit [Acidithiobacillus sp. AMEEHan]
MNRMRWRSLVQWFGLVLPAVAFAFALLMLVGLAVVPVQNDAQIYMSVTLLSIMMVGLFVIKRVPLSENIVDVLRVLNILVAVYLIFRFLVWRVEFTIGGYGPASLIFGWLLFLSEFYAATYAILGFFVNFAPRNRLPKPLPKDQDRWPLVDILVPSYNEPEEVLEVTLLGALNVSYPAEKLRVHLLDDGGTDDRCENPKTSAVAQGRRASLLKLCGMLGVSYHTRIHNVHAKAGNINAALPSLEGELLVILDADHVPTRDFLKNTVGFFLDDPLCAMVQTPHSFINPDPVEKNLDIYQDSPPEVDLFQQYIQSGLDGWGASFFVGSAAVIRRQMLLEIGGIQTDTLTEDVETAMKLHSRGYRSVFVNRSQVLGLQPETVTSFISQRVRWAQGAIQILQMKNPFFVSGLSLAQKISYLTSFSYWFFPYARIINILAPSMFLLFGVMVYNATIGQYLIYGAPYFLATWIYSDFIYGKVRWPLTSDVYEMVQTPLASVMLFSTLLRPGKRPFNVTPKGEHLETEFVSAAIRVQLLFFFIIILSLGVGTWRWLGYPAERPQLVFTMIWEILNFMIITATIVVMLEKRQVRGNYRVNLNPSAGQIIGEISLKSGAIIRVPISDLSMGGIGFRHAQWPASLDQMRSNIVGIRLVGEGEQDCSTSVLPVSMVVGRGSDVGLEFQYQSATQKQEVVGMLYSSSERVSSYSEQRKKRVGFAYSYAYFLAKTVAGIGFWLKFLRDRNVFNFSSLLVWPSVVTVTLAQRMPKLVGRLRL